MNSPNLQKDRDARSINNLVHTVYFSRIVANKIINDCLDHNVLMFFTENEDSLFCYTVSWNCANLFIFQANSNNLRRKTWQTQITQSALWA